jgi:hypothetical protein
MRSNGQTQLSTKAPAEAGRLQQGLAGGALSSDPFHYSPNSSVRFLGMKPILL